MDFDEFDTLQKKGDWEQIEIMITAIALRPENAGADCVVICTNIPHFVADKISKKIKIPLINIAEEATKKILSQKVDKVGLLATNFTMENTFYKDRLKKFGIELVIPDRVDQDFIQTVIFTELTKGIFTEK
jgi:aspartate racemase